jgi:chorismate dehydratase
MRVGAVNYLNTKPLIWGLEQGMMHEAIELTIDYPARVAQRLLSGDLDIGLVPVAVMPKLSSCHLVSDYGIACDGPVASVCLFSEVPLEQITALYLDYQSMTSVALLKLLMREHWKIRPLLLEAGSGYEKRIGGTTAGLVIGDRAFELLGKYPFVYDLGQAWKEMTGKPFVFAAWVGTGEPDPVFKRAFNQACAQGLANLDAVIAENPYPHFDLREYYTRFINYKPAFDMLEVITLFLNKIRMSG